MPQSVSYVHQDHEPANLYIRKRNTHQSTSGPLPCTIEAITRSGTDTPSSRPTGPFFTQRRGTGFLGSSQVRSSPKFATEVRQPAPAALRRPVPPVGVLSPYTKRPYQVALPGVGKPGSQNR